MINGGLAPGKGNGCQRALDLSRYGWLGIGYPMCDKEGHGDPKVVDGHETRWCNERARGPAILTAGIRRQRYPAAIFTLGHVRTAGYFLIQLQTRWRCDPFSGIC